MLYVYLFPKSRVLSCLYLQIRFALEILVLLGAIIYLFLAMKEIFHQGFNIFFTTLVSMELDSSFLF